MSTSVFWSQSHITDPTWKATREIRTQTSYCETWSDGAYIANSDFGHDSAIEAVEKKGPGLVLFAHHFISNVGR